MVLQEFTDYIFVEHPNDDDQYAIKLLTGDYEGVIYAYKTISARADEFRVRAILNYTYEVLLDPGEIITNKSHFEHYIGDVLTSVITNINRSDNPEEQMVFAEHEQPRNDNNSESSLQ